MCGRFVSATPSAQVAAFFEAEPLEFDLVPEFNVAPTSDIHVVVEDDSGRHLRAMYWGLVPPWAKDASGSSRLINARSETVAEKPSFRSAFARRRCLVPVDGFFEWTTVPGRLRKQPMFIHSSAGDMLAFAGIWEFWHPPDATEDRGLFSCSILTCAANGAISAIHDRMPVIVARGDWTTWMTAPAGDGRLADLMVPVAESLLTMHPVSTEVNSARNHGSHLVEPVVPTPPGEIPGQGSLL